MKNSKLYNFFNSEFDLTESTKGWYRFYNPFDTGKSKSMGVNFKQNKVKCFRKSYYGTIFKFLKDYTEKDYNYIKSIIDGFSFEIIDKVNLKSEEDLYELVLPDNTISIFDKNATLQKRAFKYMVKNRKINKSILKYFNIQFCNKGKFYGNIIFPYIIDGKLLYYSGRSFTSKTHRHKFPSSEETYFTKSDLFFNEDALTNFNEVQLVEGMIDALTVGVSCIASGGSKLGQKQKEKIIKSGCDIHLIPDNGYLNKWLSLAYYFYKHDIKSFITTNINNSNFKDVNASGKKYINKKEFTLKLLKKYL